MDEEQQRNWEAVYKLDCESFEWEKIIPSSSTLKPEPRDSHSSCRIGNKMYIFGGSGKTTEKLLNELWSFCLDSHVWKKIDQKGDIPSPREGHSMCVLHARYLLTVGGYDSEQEIIYDDMHIFDVQSSNWKKVDKQTGDTISSRESQSCTMVRDQLYIFGGQGNTVEGQDTFYNDLFKVQFSILNAKSSSVNVKEIKPRLPTIPSGRASHSAIAYRNRYIIIIGGEGYPPSTTQSTGNDNQRAETGAIVSATTGAAHTQQLPPSSAKHANRKNSNGDSSQEEDKQMYPKDDVWIYDTELNYWTEINPMANKNSAFFRPRLTHVCNVWKSQLFLFGGIVMMNDLLDELMILELLDDATEEEIVERDTLKICPQCHMVFSLAEWLDYTPKTVLNDKKQSSCENQHVGGKSTPQALPAPPQKATENVANSTAESTALPTALPTTLASIVQQHQQLQQQQQQQQLSQGISVEQNIPVLQQKNDQQLLQNAQNSEMQLETRAASATAGTPTANAVTAIAVTVKELNDSGEVGQRDNVDGIEIEIVKEEFLERNADKEQAVLLDKNVKFLKLQHAQVSASFVQQTCSQMEHPFSAFALLVDNSAVLRAGQVSSLSINLLSVPARQQKRENGQQQYAAMQSAMVKGEQVDGELDDQFLQTRVPFFQIIEEFTRDYEGLSEEEFMDCMCRFDVYREVSFKKVCKDYQEIENQKKIRSQYASNLKLACLRLGRSMLFISRVHSKDDSKNVLHVGYISTSEFNNPSSNTLNVFMFSYDKKNACYLTENGANHKAIILKNIEPYITQEQLFTGYHRGNYIYVFDLQQIPKSKHLQDCEFSYNPQIGDICYKKKGVRNFPRKDLITSLVDYSLHNYLRYLYLDVSDKKLDLVLNQFHVPFESYQEALEQLSTPIPQQQSSSYQNSILAAIAVPELHREIHDCGRVRLYSLRYDVTLDSEGSEQFHFVQDTINQNELREGDEAAQMQLEGENGKASAKQTQNNTVIPLSENEKRLQGILLYSQGRLIGRAETEKFGPYFLQKIMRKGSKLLTQKHILLYHGTIELGKFLAPNMFMDRIENPFFGHVLYSTLKTFIRGTKQYERRKAAYRLAKRQIQMQLKQKDIEYENQLAKKQAEFDRKIEQHDKHAVQINKECERLKLQLQYYVFQAKQASPSSNQAEKVRPTSTVSENTPVSPSNISKNAAAGQAQNNSTDIIVIENESKKTPTGQEYSQTKETLETYLNEENVTDGNSLEQQRQKPHIQPPSFSNNMQQGAKQKSLLTPKNDARNSGTASASSAAMRNAPELNNSQISSSSPQSQSSSPKPQIQAQNVRSQRQPPFNGERDISGEEEQDVQQMKEEDQEEREGSSQQVKAEEVSENQKNTSMQLAAQDNSQNLDGDERQGNSENYSRQDAAEKSSDVDIEIIGNEYEDDEEQQQQAAALSSKVEKTSPKLEDAENDSQSLKRKAQNSEKIAQHEPPLRKEIRQFEQDNEENMEQDQY